MAEASGSPIDFQYILQTAKDVLTNPHECWDGIKARQESQLEILRKYLAPLAAVGPLCGFVGGFIGGSFSFGGALLGLIFGFVVQIIVAYLYGYIIEFLAPTFAGSCSRLDAFKLAVYSATPSYLVGVLYLLPSVSLHRIGSLIALYSLYIFYVGVEKMTTVPADRRVVFCIATIVCAVVVVALLGMVFAIAGLGAVGIGAFVR